MKRKSINPSSDLDKVTMFHEGDIIFTKRYGQCKVEFIDYKNLDNMPGLSARDDNGKIHFVNAKDIIVEG